MKFVLYCEIPDNKKDQIKKCVDIVEKITPVKVKNIFVTEEDTSTVEPNMNKVMHKKHTPHISKPEPADRGWRDYDSTSHMPTL